MWAIKNDSVYNNTSLEMSDGACAVVADRLFHNLTVGVAYLERMRMHVGQSLSGGC